MSTKGVYRFAKDCGRMGRLDGIFVSTDVEVSAINGQTVYFCEVLGKHSEIEVDIDDKCVTLISADPAVVEMVEIVGLTCGHNPLEYIE